MSTNQLKKKFNYCKLRKKKFKLKNATKYKKKQMKLNKNVKFQKVLF